MTSDYKQYDSNQQPKTFDRPDQNLDNFIQNWDFYSRSLMIFLGAGASMGATDQTGRKLPTAVGLRDELWSTFMLSKSERANPPNLGLLSLEHACALIETKAGRGPLADYVGRRFTVNSPLWPHSVLPFLKPRALYTTNYDELIELGWQLHTGAARPSPIFSPPQQKLASGFIPLFKPHGTAQYASGGVGEGGLVLTQFDYFAMLHNKRKMLDTFLEEMRNSCVVFVGYSFQDMDIASILHSMRSKNRDLHWYAVFPRDDPNVRSMYTTPI
ncbi:MAG: SIR2 family protein [Deltaproteobacteria bacterium]|nr:SIR2 family protein [Deltaproteobacteria bacterium]